MDGLLVIDKPVGPTSHDVVARVRRALRERRIGHTGTLDPAATGVLPLVVGRATRLARFLSASDKTLRRGRPARVRRPTPATRRAAPSALPHADALPSRDAIEAALDAFRGTFLQQPPAFSAKKIDGTRSYKLARAERAQHRSTPHSAPSTLAPAIEHAAPSHGSSSPRQRHRACDRPASIVDGDSVTLRVDCSAGFYVRSLAHDLGDRLGTGAHLAALRRTRSGDFTLRDSVALDAVERDRDGAATRFVPLARMLPRACRRWC